MKRYLCDLDMDLNVEVHAVFAELDAIDRVAQKRYATFADKKSEDALVIRAFVAEAYELQERMLAAIEGFCAGTVTRDNAARAVEAVREHVRSFG